APKNFVGSKGAANFVAFTTPAPTFDPNDPEASLLTDAGNGILITGAGSSENHIEFNAIYNNDGEGIRIGEGASKNFIGGATAGTGNRIYGNADGIVITGQGTSGNVAEGDDIGLDGQGNAVGNQTGSGVAM